MSQLNPLENYDIFYEEELESSVDEASDPFMARDLDVEIGNSFTGRVLKKVADDESYALEIVDKWPYVYSREGKTSYGVSDEKPFSDESVEIGTRVMQVLESQGELSAGEVEKLSDYLVSDRREFSTKIHRRGETKDLLKETPEVEYRVENEKFEWNP